MVLHEAAIRKNRRGIVALAILAIVNFWVVAIILVFCVVVGSIVALLAEGFVEGLDFDLLAAFVRALPDIAVEVFTSPITAIVALAFVLAGSVVAAITLLFRLGGWSAASCARRGRASRPRGRTARSRTCSRAWPSAPTSLRLDSR